MKTSRLGETIRAKRIRNSLTQSELASKLGVSSQLVGFWETGRSRPNQERIVEIEGIIGSVTRKNNKQPEPASDTVPIVGKWLSQALNRKDMTVVELANESGVSQATIYNLQNGRAENPRRSTIARLERALGQSLPTDSRRQIQEESRIEDVGEFVDLNPHEESEIPDEPGIYVLYDITERPVYVGQAATISRRIKDHSDKFWFKAPIVNNASYIKIADKSMRERIEKILIKFLKKNAVINTQGVDRE